MNTKHQIFIPLFLSLYCFALIQAGIFDKPKDPFTKEDFEKFMEKISKDCHLAEMTENPIIDGKSLYKLIQKAHCALSCIHKTAGIITEDNKLNKDAVKFVETLTTSQDGIPCINPPFYDLCSNITESDSCEYGYQIHKCFSMACKMQSYNQTSEAETVI